MLKPDLNFVRRQPLFYAAILLSLILGAANFFIPDLFNGIPKNDLFYLAQKGPVNVYVEGQIVSEVDERENNYHEKFTSFILRCDGAGKTRATVKNPPADFSFGDVIRISGELSLPDGPRNPGGFDFRAYLGRQGIYTLLFSGKGAQCKIISRHRGNPILEKSYAFRHFLSQNLSAGFGEEDAAFLKALLLGEKRDLSAEFEDLFIRTGTMHLLAVSGFNVGFLSAAVLFLLLPFGLSKNFKWLFVLGVLWAYCLLVGWQAPLVRASVMATILICGKLLGKKVDILNSLGLAAIFILAVNPKSLFDIGFQLSFLAVAGMALFVPLFTRRREFFPNEKLTIREKMAVYASELFWVSFVASFVTLPVTVQNFYIVTPLSLLANMIVVPLSFWLFFCGIVYFLTFWWAPKIIYFLPLAMKFLMQIFTQSLIWIAARPASCVTVGKLCAPLEILLVLGVAYFFFDKKIKSRAARAFVLVVFSLNIFLFQDIARHFNRRFSMTALDVGQGDAIYFEFPHGGNLLVDAGSGKPGDKGRRVVMPYLKFKGVRTLDALVVSHPQEDHIGGMEAVLEGVRVKNIYDAEKFYPSHLYKKLKNKIFQKKINAEFVGRGAEIDGFRDARIQVLNPAVKKETSKNINNDSVVLKISHAKTSFLLTGDIEHPAMKEMMEEGLDIHADVLKVPHHGAKPGKASQDFIENVAPKISVISVGSHNSYGHPRQETLDLLASISGNKIFRTDQQGAVCIQSDGQSVSVVAP